MMEPPIRHTSENSNHLLSGILRWGLTAAIICVIVGAVMFLASAYNEPLHYSIFHGEPDDLSHIPLIFLSAIQGNSLAIIQFGILLLIATPLLRVITCIVVFANEKDYLFVGLATFVLFALFYSIL